MVNRTALVTLGEIFLGERPFLTSSYIIPSLIFYLILSFSLDVGSMYSPSDTDGCAKNLDDKNKHEENEEYIGPTSKENDKIKSKTSEGII